MGANRVATSFARGLHLLLVERLCCRALGTWNTAPEYGTLPYQVPQHLESLETRHPQLPGNGAYRLASSPREYSCPSDAEENAAL